MKFFVNNDLKKQKHLKIMISSLLAFFTLFIVSNVAVKASTFGVTVEELRLNLLGNEDLFIEPYPFSSLLEMIHIDLFFLTMLFMVIAALYFRVSSQKRFSNITLLVLLLTIILSMIAPFLALHELFNAISIWFYSFLASQLMFLFVQGHILYLLWRKNA